MIIGIYGSAVSGRELLARNLAYHIAGAHVVSITNTVLRSRLSRHFIEHHGLAPLNKARYVNRIHNRRHVNIRHSMGCHVRNVDDAYGSIEDAIKVNYADLVANDPHFLLQGEMYENPRDTYIVEDAQYVGEFNAWRNVHTIHQFGLITQDRAFDNLPGQAIAHSIPVGYRHRITGSRGSIDTERLQRTINNILGTLYGR